MRPATVDWHYFRSITHYIREIVLGVYLESEQQNDHPGADNATPGRVTAVHPE
jgi:hypothetical protein